MEDFGIIFQSFIEIPIFHNHHGDCLPQGYIHQCFSFFFPADAESNCDIVGTAVSRFEDHKMPNIVLNSCDCLRLKKRRGEMSVNFKTHNKIQKKQTKDGNVFALMKIRRVE